MFEKSVAGFSLVLVLVLVLALGFVGVFEDEDEDGSRAWNSQTRSKVFIPQDWDELRIVG